jgi:hypothetical protein
MHNWFVRQCNIISKMFSLFFETIQMIQYNYALNIYSVGIVVCMETQGY